MLSVQLHLHYKSTDARRLKFVLCFRVSAMFEPPAWSQIIYRRLHISVYLTSEISWLRASRKQIAASHNNKKWQLERKTHRRSAVQIPHLGEWKLTTDWTLTLVVAQPCMRHKNKKNGAALLEWESPSLPARRDAMRAAAAATPKNPVVEVLNSSWFSTTTASLLFFFCTREQRLLSTAALPLFAFFRFGNTESTVRTVAICCCRAQRAKDFRKPFKR